MGSGRRGLRALYGGRVEQTRSRAKPALSNQHMISEADAEVEKSTERDNTG
jgi:hypothetical protein